VANEFHQVRIIEELKPRYSRKEWDGKGGYYENKFTAILCQILTLSGKLRREHLHWKPKEYMKLCPNSAKELHEKWIPCSKKEWVERLFDYNLYKYNQYRKCGWL